MRAWQFEITTYSMKGHHFLPILFYFGLVLITLHECTLIECHGTDTCSESHFVCKDDEECIITCAGDHSCHRTQISCPQNHVCLISCVGDNAISESICEYLTVNATLSAYLSVQASANWNTLRSSVIHCPYAGPCDLNANGRHVMTFMDVYAVQGFTDLNIQCHDCYLGDLYCTESFQHLCHMDATMNQCQTPCNSLYEDRDAGFEGQICNAYTHTEPPSDTPSATPTTNPTANPSVSPTVYPSAQPSASSTVTIDPSSPPSASPTVHPSDNPPSPVPHSSAPFAVTTRYPSFHPSATPTTHPPSSIPSMPPTDPPSENPSSVPSVSPSTVAPNIEICEDTCKGTSVLFVKLDFELSSDIMYNSNNLECYMYTILFEYLHRRFDFAQYFEVCDTEASVFGGEEIMEGCADGYVPCFMQARRRMLLETETTASPSSDGVLYVSMITNNEDTRTILEGSKHTTMEMTIRNAFKHDFGLRVGIIIKDIDIGEFNMIEVPDSLDDGLGPDLTEEQSDDVFMGHFSGTRDQWICVGTFLGVLLVLFPFEIYYTLKLYKSRFEPFIHTRHPTLNTVINLTAALFLVIERPMHAIHRLSVYNELWFQWTRLGFYFMAMQFLLGGVVLRFWLLLFEVKWTQSMTNKEWKKHVDTTIGTKTESFWVRSHGTWGNVNFVWKYIVTVCILLGTVPIFLAYTNKEYFIGSMAHGVLLGSGVLILYILWRTTPIFHDEFKIMEECGFVITWIGVAILMDLIFTSLKIIFDETFWIWFLSFSVPFLLLSGVIFLQSYWVLSEMSKSKFLNSVHAYETKLNLELLDPPDADSSRSNVMEPETMSLYQILADKTGCHEFIAHLLKEFSFENILSVIEMTQYKQCFLTMKRYQQQMEQMEQMEHADQEYKAEEEEEDEDEDDDEDVDYDDERRYHEPLRSDSENSIDVHDIELYGEAIIELPRNLPRSTIVWSVPVDRMTIQDLRNMTALLYAKYIKLGSELELNISYKLRRETTKKFSELAELDELQLYTFFDGTLNAMIKLMHDSYSRFRMTKGFVKYEMAFLRRRHSSTRPSIKLKIKKVLLSPHVSADS